VCVCVCERERESYFHWDGLLINSDLPETCTKHLHLGVIPSPYYPLMVLNISVSSFNSVLSSYYSDAVQNCTCTARAVV
jgi:hypothetical protein